MRIALNTFALSPHRGMGGPGRYQLGLIQGLAALNAAHTFLLLCNAQNADLLPDVGNFERIVLGPLTARPSSRIVWEHVVSPLSLLRLGVDVLHSTNFVSPLMVPCVSVVTVHDMTWFTCPELHQWTKRQYFQRLIPVSVRRSERVITDSASSRCDVIDLLQVAPGKVEAIHLGVDTTRFRPTNDDASRSAIEGRYGVRSKAYILYVGGIHPRKNVAGLVKAFELIRQRGAREKLLLVGGLAFGNEELLGTIHASAARDDIVLAGQAPDDDLPALYTNASVVAYPSFYEGFGFPVLEAMACGTPVVTSTTSSLPEVAGAAALMADPSSVEDLAEKIWSVLTDRALRMRMVSSGLEWVLRFTWKETARKTTAVYEHAYASGKGVRVA